VPTHSPSQGINVENSDHSLTDGTEILTSSQAAVIESDGMADALDLNVTPQESVGPVHTYPHGT
jgi:hypothetical protein